MDRILTYCVLLLLLFLLLRKSHGPAELNTRYPSPRLAAPFVIRTQGFASWRRGDRTTRARVRFLGRKIAKFSPPDRAFRHAVHVDARAVFAIQKRDCKQKKKNQKVKVNNSATTPGWGGPDRRRIVVF